MYDYHVHSSFSADCSTDMETMVKGAIGAGLKEMCFTDHIDQDYKGDPSFRFNFDPPAYSKCFQELKSRYKSRINLKKGVELGLQPQILSKCQEIVDTGSFDFVIASIHTCGLQDIHNGDYFLAKTPLQAYRQYYEELCTCVRSFQGFNVIGHLDLLKRYRHYAAPQPAHLFSDILEELFRDLISRGKGIEVNTSGYRYSCSETLPSPGVLNLYRSLGGEVITIGSDAHAPEHLGANFAEAYQLLKDVGFKYITTFTGQMPEFKKIP